MTVARHLLHNPEIAHGPIRIGFTPDEEIGRGVHADLPADLGGRRRLHPRRRRAWARSSTRPSRPTRRSCEIKGVSIHPGQAKDKLVNALHLAAKIVDTLPQVTLHAETTDGRAGLHPPLPDAAAPRPRPTPLHPARLRARRPRAPTASCSRQVCAAVQATEPRARITCTITPQYRNMRYWLENDMRPVELAREACRQAGVEPFSGRSAAAPTARA